jgi:Amt family ammonium transporter
MKRFLQVFLTVSLLGLPALGFAADAKAAPAPAVADVTDLAATAGNKSVVLNWKDPAGATAFKVTYPGADGKTVSVDAKPGDGAKGVTLTTGILNAQAVTATVVTVGANGKASAGVQASATTFALDSGATAWMMTSAAIVLLMTVPGLALFYGGMVRRKNILATMAYSYGASIIVSIVWVVVQYSMAFSGNLDPFGALGDFSKSFMNGVIYMTGGDTSNAKVPLWGATGVPEAVFSMFQLMFAIITVALISGSIVERMAFGAWLFFSVLWSLIVYAPLAHMVWGGGFLSDMNNGLAHALGLKGNALDFAGGLVVHTSSGVSALVLALLLGPRVRYGKDTIVPNNIAFTATGAALLWVGWFGFNAGSAVGSNGLAASAFTVTNTAAAMAAVTWIVIEYIHHRKMTMVGISTGVVAGLVAITPASGFVDIWGALAIGIAVSVVCYLFVAFVKKALNYDDSLDAFGVHAIGGTLGALMTGIFAVPAVGYYFDGVTPAAGVIAGNPGQFTIQVASVVIAWVWAIVGTIICYFLVRIFTKARVEPQEEVIGLDLTQHGEKQGER